MNGKYDDLTAEEIIKLLVGSGEEIKEEVESDIDSMTGLQCSALACMFVGEMEKLQIGDFGKKRPEEYLIFDKEDGEVNPDKAPKINGQALCKDLNLSKEQLRTVLTVAMMAQAAEFAVTFKKMAAEKTRRAK